MLTEVEQSAMSANTDIAPETVVPNGDSPRGEKVELDGPTRVIHMPPAITKTEAQIAEENKPQKRIGIIGYTTSREEAPYGNPDWELWGMNNLHRFQEIDDAQFARWYNLHDLTNLAAAEDKGGDPAHLAWLQKDHGFPIYLMDPLEGVEDAAPLAERTSFPNAVAFPKQKILARFRPYFTNTVSWQVAHALYEALTDEDYVLTDIGMFGIDMAVDSEYNHQRPSVEYFLGLCEGLGIQVHLPTASDLLKSAELYGGEDANSGMRAKVKTRRRELQEQKDQLEAHMEQVRLQHASVLGALDSFGYIDKVWMPPVAESRDGIVVPADARNSDIGQWLTEKDKIDREKGA